MSKVSGKVNKVELYLEIHLLNNLSVDLIVGIDTI